MTKVKLRIADVHDLLERGFAGLALTDLTSADHVVLGRVLAALEKAESIERERVANG